MATIKARQQADGSVRYTAIVRGRKGTVILHRESRTLTHRTAALSWARHREVELERPGALIRTRDGSPTVAELVRWYIDTFETISRRQRSKWSSQGGLRRSLHHSEHKGSILVALLGVHYGSWIRSCTSSNV